MLIWHKYRHNAKCKTSRSGALLIDPNPYNCDSRSRQRHTMNGESIAPSLQFTIQMYRVVKVGLVEFGVRKVARSISALRQSFIACWNETRKKVILFVNITYLLSILFPAARNQADFLPTLLYLDICLCKLCRHLSRRFICMMKFDWLIL